VSAQVGVERGAFGAEVGAAGGAGGSWVRHCGWFGFVC
jgi:hypothetical protein